MDNLPVGIKVDRNDNLFVISWKNGHISAIGFSLLRHACPCVVCRGGHEKMSSDPDPEIFSLPVEDSERTKISDVVSVGSYAITIVWGDGHDSGIYNWDYLRALCPCNECRPS